jgi:hypothetical protein
MVVYITIEMSRRNGIDTQKNQMHPWTLPMYYAFGVILGFFIVLGQSVAPSPVSAEQDLTQYGTIRFNNENWHILPHPKVAAFSMHEDGSTSGITDDGRTFIQYMVPNSYGIRVQRFEIEDHYHYIVEGETANSFTEFSALLALAYERTITS